jgi:hypothetical protein
MESAQAIVVDGANVIGSRPDGWWRDRAGAARRLLGQLEHLAVTSPDQRFILVVEGAARVVAAERAARDGRSGPHRRDSQAVVAGSGVMAGGRGVEVVAADGSGDDAILDLAGRLAGQPGGCLVVTADRELRRWCEAAGASVAGPGWLLGRL